MIFLYMLRKQISIHKYASFLLLCGVVVCIYCISVMFGVSNGLYELENSHNINATITVDVGVETKNNIDKINEYVYKMSKKGVLNVIYFTKVSEKQILIGWDGTEAGRWFPITTGSFFDAKMQENAQNVAFVSDSWMVKYNKNEIEIDGENFKIIGSGWIVPWNFEAALSKESTINLFEEDYSEIKYSYDDDMEYVIIPYKCYKEKYLPEQIFIHLRCVTNSQLIKYVNELSDEFSDSHFCMPDNNTDEIFVENQIRYGKIAVVLCLMAGITVIRVMYEWINFYQKDIDILRLCGMTRLKGLMIIYGHWSIYYVIGVVIALFLHYKTFPLLSLIYLDAFPDFYTLIIALAVVYTVSVLCTLKQTLKMTA